MSRSPFGTTPGPRCDSPTQAAQTAALNRNPSSPVAMLRKNPGDRLVKDIIGSMGPSALQNTLALIMEVYLKSRVISKVRDDHLEGVIAGMRLDMEMDPTLLTAADVRAWYDTLDEIERIDIKRVLIDFRSTPVVGTVRVPTEQPPPAVVKAEVATEQPPPTVVEAEVAAEQPPPGDTTPDPVWEKVEPVDPKQAAADTMIWHFQQALLSKGLAPQQVSAATRLKLTGKGAPRDPAESLSGPNKDWAPAKVHKRVR